MATAKEMCILCNAVKNGCGQITAQAFHKDFYQVIACFLFFRLISKKPCEAQKIRDSGSRSSSEGENMQWLGSLLAFQRHLLQLP